jgi:FtsP/CotA-like multicopper oxidase with cupredoxin domain
VAYDANHPFHLHGYQFRVVAMERLGNTTTAAKVKELDRQGLIVRKLARAPLKDTVTVPDGGYTIVRFHANNPGKIAQ